MIPDRYFYPLVVLAVTALISLAIVWPQGEGARSPGPFGHALAPPTTAPSAVAPTLPPPAAPPPASSPPDAAKVRTQPLP